MSKGHSQSRSQSGRRALRKNKGKERIGDVVVIDADVVIIDAPETSGRPSRGVRERRAFPIDAITIEDEEDSCDAPSNVRDDATNKAFYFASNSSYSAEEPNNEQCHMLSRKRNFASTLKGNTRRKCNFFTPINCFGLDLTSESNLSENASFGSDNSDCEIVEDSSGDVRKQWERAALRKRASVRDQLSSEDRASATGSSADPVFRSPERTHPKADAPDFIHLNSLNNQEDVPVETGSTNSRNACGNLSSTVPTVNKHTERPPEANVNNIVEDSVMTPGVCHEVGTQQEEELIGTDFSCQMPNVDNSVAESIPTPGVCHGVDPHTEEELISEECSHKMQSFCETHFEFRRCNFRDVEVPLRGPSPCCSGLHATPEKTLNHMETHWDTNIGHEFMDVLEKEKPFEPPLCNSQFLGGPQLNAVSHCVCSNEEATSREQLVDDHAMNGATENNLVSQPEKDLPPLQCGMISDREKHKASDLYMRADEIEWASRQQQLLIQSEEAHRLRKKKRAERFLLDMERRQKQRVEEVRESQRKDEETINLKDEIRAEVRKELNIVEMRYRDMASLLRALGVHVEGGPFPRACEVVKLHLVSHDEKLGPHVPFNRRDWETQVRVNAAYKQALLKLHPDRSARLNDIRQQVMAEEKFKLILLKKKLLPAF